MFKYLFLFFLITDCFALVDYYEVAPKKKSKIVMEKKVLGNPWYKGVKLGLDYESYKISDTYLNLLKIGAKYFTDFNLYIDTSFWGAKGQGGSFDPGNLGARIGYSMRSKENATFDIIAGANFSSWVSDYSSGRIDQIYSVSTTKKFYKFVVGLGADFWVTGDSKIEDVTSVGNIGSFYALAGWEISGDIGLFIEGALVTIEPGKEASKDERVKYTYISPLLQLGIFSQLWVELGATFRISDEGYDDSLVNARLFDLKGAYGSSLFTGLKYSL